MTTIEKNELKALRNENAKLLKKLKRIKDLISKHQSTEQKR